MLPLSVAAVKSVFMVLLVRAPNPPALSAEEGEKLQAAHIANLERLGRAGDAMIAGPFDNGGRYRGIVVVKATSSSEAATLAATDPTVQAKRLALEVYPWNVPLASFTHFKEPIEMQTLTVVFHRHGDPIQPAIMSGTAASGFSAISVLPKQAAEWKPQGDAFRLDWWCAKGVLPGA